MSPDLAFLRKEPVLWRPISSLQGTPGRFTLVTWIAAASNWLSQIASGCNRNSKKSLRLRKHPLKPTLWTRDLPVLRGFSSVSEASHRSGYPRNPCDYKVVIANCSVLFCPMRFLWLRHCNFTAISVGKACDFEVVIANRQRFVSAIASVTKRFATRPHSI